MQITGPKVEGCNFCEPDRSRILYTDEDFYIMLSLGPIIEGYSLLISQAHFDCCASIPATLKGRFLYLKKQIRQILQDVYGACLFFEHGRVGASLTVGTADILCHHAHLHCVPASADMHVEISSLLKPLSLARWKELRNIYIKYGEYFYYEDFERNKYAYIVNQAVPRQFLRSVLANMVGHPNRANWREYAGYPLIRVAQKKLEIKFANVK
jgi:diadenosine tetraphosphate (Ap4A) HIT family hydrolase